MCCLLGCGVSIAWQLEPSGSADPRAQEADDRLLQNNLQHTFVVQTCKEGTPQDLLLDRVIAFDKDQLKLLRPPHDALKLVEDDIDVCVGLQLHLAWHGVSPVLIESAGLWCVWEVSVSPTPVLLG